MLTLIERVLFLQAIDVFSEVPSEELGFIGAIAEEEQHGAGETIYREQDPADAMYLVVRGKVRLHRGEVEVSNAGEGEAFGTWALFDDEPRLTSATVVEPSQLLRIDREAFIDLLADNVGVTQGVLKAVVRRLRSVLDRIAPS